jgi:hypothetical protein
MSAKKAGPGYFNFDGTEQQERELSPEDLDKFVKKYGRAIEEIYQFLMSIENADDFYRFGRGLVAAVGVAAAERVKSLDNVE